MFKRFMKVLSALLVVFVFANTTVSTLAAPQIIKEAPEIYKPKTITTDIDNVMTWDKIYGAESYMVALLDLSTYPNKKILNNVKVYTNGITLQKWSLIAGHKYKFWVGVTNSSGTNRGNYIYFKVEKSEPYLFEYKDFKLGTIPPEPYGYYISTIVNSNKIHDKGVAGLENLPVKSRIWLDDMRNSALDQAAIAMDFGLIDAASMLNYYLSNPSNGSVYKIDFSRMIEESSQAKEYRDKDIKAAVIAAEKLCHQNKTIEMVSNKEFEGRCITFGSINWSFAVHGYRTFITSTVTRFSDDSFSMTVHYNLRDFYDYSDGTSFSDWYKHLIPMPFVNQAILQYLRDYGVSNAYNVIGEADYTVTWNKGDYDYKLYNIQ